MSDMDKKFKEIFNDDNKDFDSQILDFIKDFFNSKDIELKTELPKADFQKILKLAVYQQSIKRLSPQAYKFIKEFLKTYFKFRISYERKGRNEFFNSIKTLKQSLGFDSGNEEMKKRFLRWILFFMGIQEQVKLWV